MTVTNVSVVTANGVSGSVADPTTTPAITLTLGAITPSSVNGAEVINDANNNTGFGSSVLNSLTSGTANTAMGYNTLTAVTSGANNTAHGWSALKTVTTGAGNTAVGCAALEDSSGGASDNTAVGNAALQQNTTGSVNTAVGASALVVNSDANYNTAIGGLALNNTTTGGHNVAIGYEAGTTNETGEGNILIGYQADVPTGSTDNYLNIGGVITGNMSTGAVALANGFTATTQAASDNSTKLATTAYVDAAAGGGTKLLAANNLSDVANAATSRTNLGLGTAATLNVGTGANQVVQLNGSAQLPAVDGSLLTGVSAPGSLTTIASGSFGAVTLVDITSIPATYRGLVLYITGASNTVATRALRVKIGDSTHPITGGTCLYDFHQISGTTVTAVADNDSPWSEVAQTAAQLSSTIINLPAYQSGPIKTFTARTNMAAAAGALWSTGTKTTSWGVLQDGGAAHTGAIDRIRITWDNVATGVFDGGTYALYGVN